MKRFVVAAVAAFFLQAPVLASQPAMEAALVNLNQAKDNLQKATEDKGGHRVKAIKLINEAISQVKAGMEFDRTHRAPSERPRK